MQRREQEKRVMCVCVCVCVWVCVWVGVGVCVCVVGVGAFVSQLPQQMMLPLQYLSHCGCVCVLASMLECKSLCVSVKEKLGVFILAERVQDAVFLANTHTHTHSSLCRAHFC